MASYSAVIDLRVNGEKKIDSVVAKVNRINGLIRGLKPVPDIFQKQRGGTEAFRNQINALKQTLSETLATFGQTGKVTGFSKTIGGLNSQLATFRSVANSAKAGSQQFTQALTAGENASRQLLKAELERLKSLQNLYQTNAKLVKGSSAGIGKQLTEVLKIGNTIPKTTAALNNYKMELERIISLVEIGSKEYKELEVAIANVNKQLDRTKPVKTQTDKKLQVEKKVTQEMSKQKQLEIDLFKQRRKNIRDRERTAKQQRQGRLLGAGFPLLFGGGIGSIGGSLAGSFLAKPGEEFGAQIFGSAVGQQIETLIKRANALGDAVDQISFEKLEEQSIIISGELRAQVELLKELGQADRARAILADQVFKRTGANADVQRDINRQVQLLNAGFSELVNSAGTTLAIIGGPLLTAVGALSAGVSLFFRGFNTLATGIRNLIPDLPVVDKFFEKLNKRIQQAIGNTKKLRKELQTVGDIQFTKFSIEMEKSFGKAAQTFDAQRENLKLQKDIIRLQNKEAKTEALKGISDEGARADIEKNFRDKLNFDIFNINKEITLLDEKEASINSKLERRLNLQTALNGINKKIVGANRAEDEQLAARLEFEKTKLGIQFQLGEDLRNAKSTEEEMLLVKTAIQDIDAARIILGEKLFNISEKMKTNFELVGETIASGVTDNISAAILQTKTLGEAAKNILNDLANTLVKLGVNTILGSIAPGIFGGLPMLKFARGGRPPTGKASLVGEKGPELFVPKRTGTVIPNDKLGGSTNISVNVDASGSSVQGDAQQSKELGRAISAAIQSELLKQRRPGGLLR